MTTATIAAAPLKGLWAHVYRPPFIGIMAFVATLMLIPIGHALMVVTEQIFGEEHRYSAAFVMGVVAIYLLWTGVRLRKEAIGTWLGFFAGITFMETVFIMWFGYLGQLALFIRLMKYRRVSPAGPAI